MVWRFHELTYFYLQSNLRQFDWARADSFDDATSASGQKYMAKPQFLFLLGTFRSSRGPSSCEGEMLSVINRFTIETKLLQIEWTYKFWNILNELP